MAAPKKKPSWLLETDSKELNGMSFDDVMNKASLPFKPTAHLEDGTPKPWKFVPRDPQEEKDEELHLLLQSTSLFLFLLPRRGGDRRDRLVNCRFSASTSFVLPPACCLPRAKRRGGQRDLRKNGGAGGEE